MLIDFVLRKSALNHLPQCLTALPGQGFLPVVKLNLLIFQPVYFRLSMVPTGIVVCAFT